MVGMWCHIHGETARAVGVSVGARRRYERARKPRRAVWGIAPFTVEECMAEMRKYAASLGGWADPDTMD